MIADIRYKATGNKCWKL